MLTSILTSSPTAFDKGLSMGLSDMEKKRQKAVRTAWWLAITTIVIFVMFILSGVLGEPSGG
jgi:hypothetical protein